MSYSQCCSNALRRPSGREQKRDGSGPYRKLFWIKFGSRPVGFFDTSAFLAALTAFNADLILFSVDYPYATNRAGTAFLSSLPVSPADRERIAHGNADALLRLPAA
ncbi:amidohydrolase family protein [Rhizobium sp. ZW T2_16]|uniref:amidohydrolase family protein n=1 Tax=Rhizobium sp. ZW T2_16 TaxID=3378083 RepID=UPI00349610D0